jgi:hypothetical protein
MSDEKNFSVLWNLRLSKQVFRIWSNQTKYITSVRFDSQKRDNAIGGIFFHVLSNEPVAELGSLTTPVFKFAIYESKAR